MIQEIYIKNFAIIEELRCQFDDQMTVLTGETGAGKSIIIDAVALLAGERASLDMIRHGAQKALVQGLFFVEQQTVIEQIQELGIEIEDHQLIVQRELDRNGKTICRMNGQLVTVATLKKIGPFLIDIHGQNEHFLLLNQEKHLSLVDLFAGNTIQDTLERYQTSFEQYQTLQRQYDQLVKSDQQDQQRIDLLSFQVDEIESARLEVGELERLEEEREYFLHFQKIQSALATSLQVLQEDTQGFALIDRLGEVVNQLSTIETIHSDYDQLNQQVQESYYQLQDATHSISRLLDHAEYDQERLDEIDERIALYTQLQRKYGSDTQTILTYAENARKELDVIENKDAHLQKLTVKLVQIRQQCVTIAEQLRDVRKQVADRLTMQVELQLKSLYMDKTTFVVQFTPLEKLSDHGLDQIEFYLSTNVGEPPKPLSKIASGGELSRITLAMKTIFSQMKRGHTVIFDEIDTGVSGRVAQAVAEKMRYIAQHAQVFCITHLPQVAALAHHHFLIEKHEKNGRTQTDLIPLKQEQRVDEIARMIAGETVSTVSRAHATELLVKATQINEPEAE